MNFGLLPELRRPGMIAGHTEIGRLLSKTVGADRGARLFQMRAPGRLITQSPTQTVYPGDTSSKDAATGELRRELRGSSCLTFFWR